MANWIESITGSLEHKREYTRNAARVQGLPEPYRAVATALQRYLVYAGGVTDGDTLVRMSADFADLWERAAADGTPVRAIIGDDPAGFAEDFARAYDGRRWIDRERARLTTAVDRALADSPV